MYQLNTEPANLLISMTADRFREIMRLSKKNVT